MADAHEIAPGNETSLSAAMSSYWYTFAVTGDPNHATAPAVWPLFTEERDEVLRFDEPAAGGIRAQAAVRKPVCDFWDAHVNLGGWATSHA
jgi:carboxylesterase type B